MSFHVEVRHGVSEIDSISWDALIHGSPLTRHAFLSALERTGCVGMQTGWQPLLITVTKENVLLGALPLYLKTHSYGEYVFDWSWADAYQRNGWAYYPKLVSAIPFTPITGRRLLSDLPEIQIELLTRLQTLVTQYDLSSAHILFPDELDAQVIRQAGWLERRGVQFRWENLNFSSFDDFLNTLSHDKRKKIRQERKKLDEANVRCKWLKGQQILKSDWDFFYQCYQNTYHQHRSTPYLTRDFFEDIAMAMPENILLVLAEQDGEPIAAALDLYGLDSAGNSCLFGRYWGSVKFVSGLHFELSYYQAQEFCIAEGIRYFEGGAQGEHKLARGFKPRPTCSFHYIANPDFRLAIADFLERDTKGIDCYINELHERDPYKHEIGV